MNIFVAYNFPLVTMIGTGSTERMSLELLLYGVLADTSHWAACRRHVYDPMVRHTKTFDDPPTSSQLISYNR